VQEVKTAAQGRYEVAVAPDQDVRAQLAATIVKGGWSLLEMAPVGMSLEEIFLQLTEEEPSTLAQTNERANPIPE
jgi:hypothetical protein